LLLLADFGLQFADLGHQTLTLPQQFVVGPHQSFI
jgi:hypothetical protein